MAEKVKIKRALISCWDKNDLDHLAETLIKFGVEIISSGGTFRYLAERNISVTKVEEITNFPEILDGRVKTLHPFIHGAILAKRTEKHLAQLEGLGIKPIDLVVVNLYPFLELVKDTSKSMAEMVESIDIGGPAMIRAAAKNFKYLTVLHKQSQYEEFEKALEKYDGAIPADLNQKFSADAFFYTSYYDSQISEYLSSVNGEQKFQRQRSMFFEKVGDLRYGENPHQQAAIYRDFEKDFGESGITQLHGKEMSFNNYVDVSAAYNLVSEFDDPAVVIIKHTNPCGAARAESIAKAFPRALAGDPVSAFGGIVAANRDLDEETARQIHSSFYECVIAPGFSSEAEQILKQKKNIRLLTKKLVDMREDKQEIKHLDFAVLFQDTDNIDYDSEKLKSVSGREPGGGEKNDLLFAWKIVKHVKSNAIVFVKDGQLLGVGAGQMSRVDSVKIARQKAAETNSDLNGAVMASDAFFPFRDGIDAAAEAGINAVIQPGGSKRDSEVIEAATEHGMAMLLTGIRHFKH